MLVVVQNEIHSFIEGILGLRGGQTEGGDRQVGGESARRAFISNESQRKGCVCVGLCVGVCTVPVESLKESLKAEGKWPEVPVQPQADHVSAGV